MFLAGKQVFRDDQGSLILRCLNWLVGQHLSSQRCWLTTSLMARLMLSNVRKYQTVLSCCSEAEFPEFGPPRAGVVGMVGERGKQYCTETLSKYLTDSVAKFTLLFILPHLSYNREKLEELLETLNIPGEAVESVTRAYFSSPQVSLLSQLLFSFSKSTAASTDQEQGVEAKLCRIEGKYEKILQQVFFSSMHNVSVAYTLMYLSCIIYTG